MDTSGKCCIKCGGTDFRKSGKCKACAATSIAKWRSENKEKVAAYRAANRERDRRKEAEYRTLNRDKYLASQARFKADNPEKTKEYKVKHYAQNTDLVKMRAREFFNANRERQLELTKQWKRNNPDKTRETHARYTAKIRGTVIGRLAHNVSARIRSSLRAGGYTKRSRAHQILGCDWEFFKAHIEKQFVKGMCWEKLGTEIHIDHIVPVASAETEEDVLILNHFTNLRPYWAVANMSKGAARTHLL